MMTALLIVIALTTLGAASVAMTLRNLIRSVVLLIGSWIGIAVFYLWAGAEFVAFAQILVYVGAVSMVVLFAVLLTRRSRVDLPLAPDSKKRAFSAILAAASVFIVLLYALSSTAVSAHLPPPGPLTVKQIGTELTGTHAAALLVIGMILTVATLGGVLLAATDSASNEEDAP